MHKKMMISIDEEIYAGLLRAVGRGNISRFFEDLARPFAVGDALDNAYREMAADAQRETEAMEWCNALVGDVHEGLVPAKLPRTAK
jgi:hypothetical protein